MFLERKFAKAKPTSSMHEPALCPGMTEADWSRFPPLVYDVFCNLQLLCKARRGYDHILPDFGLSPSEGYLGQDALVEQVQRDALVTFARYEPRLQLEQMDVEADDAGALSLRVVGKIGSLEGSFGFSISVTKKRIEKIEYLPPATSA